MRIKLSTSIQVLMLDHRLAGAPKLFELTTMLQTFVTRLMALDGQLTDFADDQGWHKTTT